MKNNKKGFSIAIAMGLVLVSSLLAYAILEYIIPFSKNIKGIENSTRAFYKATEGVEEGLYFVSNRNDLRAETGAVLNGEYSYLLNTFSSGSKLPLVGKGNSEINKNWNKIAPGEPIQLNIGDGVIENFSDFETYVKVPDLGNTLTLSGSDIGIINWQLSGQSNSINAYFSGSINNLITADNIGDSNNFTKVVLSSSVNNQGRDLYNSHGANQEIEEFYNDNCGSGSGCTLKLSIINKLESTNGQSIPYLEWKMEFDSGDYIPLRYTNIETSGVSYGFKKNLEVKVPQSTVSEAFDFTVFQ